MQPIAPWWPSEYLFLLMHQSTLATKLASLLMTQLGLHGTCRSGLKYARRGDLVRLRWQLARTSRSWPKGRFIFDTLMSNDAFVPLRLLGSSRLRVLVCLCRPETSLQDMLRGTVKSPQDAADSYCQRAEWLAAAGQNLGERALVFPAQMIVEGTATLLAAIALHLDLDTCRSSVPQQSEAPSVDSRDCLHTPTLREASSEADTTFLIAPALMDRCRDAYHRAAVELGNCCLSIGLEHLHHVDDDPRMAELVAARILLRPGWCSAFAR